MWEVALVTGVFLAFVSPTYATTIRNGIPEIYKNGQMSINLKDDGEPGYKIECTHPDGNVNLQGRIGKSIDKSTSVSYCEPNNGYDTCLQWENEGVLMLKSYSVPSENGKDDIQCNDVVWNATSCLQDDFVECFDMGDAHWYGGTQIKSQLWPVEKWNRPMEPYVTGDSMNDQYGGVQERYWLSSKGSTLKVSFESPLWVSINDNGDNQICFKATYKDSPYLNYDETLNFLSWSTCSHPDIVILQKSSVTPPSDIPDERLFRYPIWSTWAQYGADINQTTVMMYAQDILDNGFNNAQLEIDDKWENGYGELEFDFVKFPDPSDMVNKLSTMGFRTTLWVHPFQDILSDGIWGGGLLFHYIRDPGRLLPALTTWWNGVATTIDVTSERTRNWWLGKLDDLRQTYGIHSFKFDAGESNWLPACYTPATNFRNPGQYSTTFARMAYESDKVNRSLEVRIGAMTQDLPVFVRMMDKDSRWDNNNGLKTVIPHALTYGIIGYPFVLPDMIGGNAYGEYPDRELFIRWVQVNVFLPGFQFSIPPWVYDSEVVSITKKMVELHELFADKMIELATESTETGAPIVRPLWWIAPNDSEALVIDSEFLLGNDILVAPILEPGATSRDVYLPNGIWRDNIRNEEFNGGRWYSDFEAQLDELPYFTRIQ